jgi:hypothetical protein
VPYIVLLWLLSLWYWCLSIPRNGVQEYLVWQTFENRFSWFRLQAEEFVVIEPDADGMIRSRVFPGLWLNVPALLEGRMTEVLNGVQAGIADPMHQAFVQLLAERAALQILQDYGASCLEKSVLQARRLGRACCFADTARVSQSEMSLSIRCCVMATSRHLALFDKSCLFQ